VGSFNSRFIWSRRRYPVLQLVSVHQHAAHAGSAVSSIAHTARSPLTRSDRFARARLASHRHRKTDIVAFSAVDFIASIGGFLSFVLSAVTLLNGNGEHSSYGWLHRLYVPTNGITSTEFHYSTRRDPREQPLLSDSTPILQ